MFHRLSQAAVLLFSPTNGLLILVLFGLLVGIFKRTAARGRRLAIAAAVALCILAILPIGDWLLTPLETRFPPFEPDGRPVAGIIVLGGTISIGKSSSGPRFESNQSASRLFEAARLARLFPSARVLASGGPENPEAHSSEADIVGGYLAALGVAPARLLLERRSKDTFENAKFSAALVHPKPGQRWLLVTSAAHMPRAIGCFRQAGFTVVAAPTDWRVGPGGRFTGWSASGSLGAVDAAWKEYLGAVTYRLTGRTSELFPGP